uniref:Uncharacterized protein n=1 Tax=Amphimedon queenslandica TaxID=400682 RepID=A0A1X7TWP9_AMPQE
ETRVGKSLQRENTGYNCKRRESTSRIFNPVPYHADYFGHKEHNDQSENLVMYGVTHVCAIDRFSGKLVGFITTQVKNSKEIYSDHRKE